MVEVEGKILQTPVSILIDPGSSLSYISPAIVEKCKLIKQKYKKSWLVWLTIGTKRRVTYLVKVCMLDMNGLITKRELNILPLGSFMGMD